MPTKKITISKSIGDVADLTTFVPLTDFDSNYNYKNKVGTWNNNSCIIKNSKNSGDTASKKCFWARNVNFTTVKVKEMQKDGSEKKIQYSIKQNCLDDTGKALKGLDLCKAKISDLKPGQAEVGFYSVLNKLYDKNLNIVSSDELQKRVTKKIIPVVISPSGKLHLADSHHRTSGIFLVTSLEQMMPIRVIQDYRDPIIIENEFIKKMVESGTQIFLTEMIKKGFSVSKKSDFELIKKEYYLLPQEMGGLKQGYFRDLIDLWDNCAYLEPDCCSNPLEQSACTTYMEQRPFFYQFKWGGCLNSHGLLIENDNDASNLISLINSKYKILGKDQAKNCGFNANTSLLALKYKYQTNPSNLINEQCYDDYKYIIDNLSKAVNFKTIQDVTKIYIDTCNLPSSKIREEPRIDINICFKPISR